MPSSVSLFLTKGVHLIALQEPAQNMDPWRTLVAPSLIGKVYLILWVIKKTLTSVPKLFFTDSPRIFLLMYFAKVDVMMAVLSRWVVESREDSIWRTSSLLWSAECIRISWGLRSLCPTQIDRLICSCFTGRGWLFGETPVSILGSATKWTWRFGLCFSLGGLSD